MSGEYPRVTPEGVTVWACCESSIGPACGHMRVSNDPDGFDCYSDHAADIDYCGECAMCGSSDAAVVGHVLPDVPRVVGVGPVAAARMVLADQSARMFDGMLLDLFTASHIVAVHDALGERNQAKLQAMSLPLAASVCFKLANR